MLKKEILKSEDGACPKCRSQFVLKTDKKSTVRGESCDVEVVVWKCYQCNREFYCADEL
jgi:RNase P subunit RPR2